MTESYMGKCSISLISQEMQTTITMRYSFLFVRIFFINMMKDNKYWLSVDKKKLLYSVNGMSINIAIIEKVWRFLKILNDLLTSFKYIQRLQSQYIEEINVLLCLLHIIHNNQDTESTYKPISGWMDKESISNVPSRVLIIHEKEFYSMGQCGSTQETGVVE